MSSTFGVKLRNFLSLSMFLILYFLIKNALDLISMPHSADSTYFVISEVSILQIISFEDDMFLGNINTSGRFPIELNSLWYSL